MSSPTWLVETRNLTRIYGDGGDAIYALNDVNLCVAPGELVAIMGPSGSGKSTLLNMLGALDKPTSGQVIVDGQDLAKIRNKDKFRGNTVGFVFQLHNLLPTLTARENVEVPMMGHLSAGKRHKRAKELLEAVSLADRMNHLPGQLSGGQRQRVAVARALANNPPLVLADEPTGALDTASGLELLKLIRQLNADQGVTFITVTHDPAVARQMKRVVVMSDGKIAREDIIGSPLEEDLKIWAHSGLGRRIIQGKLDEVGEFVHSKAEMEALRKLLAQSNGE
jgi:ABC-type lipoprotein export system ATPase subunit